MQTSNLSIDPTYDSSGTITGYQASDELTVTLHDLSRSGAVIDAAARSVGNDVQLDGVSFSVADTSPLLAEARASAMRAARARASALAAAAGVSLGPIVSIHDDEQQQGPPSPFVSASAASAGTMRSVPIEAGTQQLSVQVDVVYELRGGRS
jgi:hypothetical protein